jgi:hypothetical protein
MSPALVDRPDGSVWAVVPYGMLTRTVAYAVLRDGMWHVRVVQDPRPPVVCKTRADARLALADLTGATP